MKTLEETIKHFKENPGEYSEVAIKSLEAWVRIIEADDVTKVVDIVRDYVSEVRV